MNFPKILNARRLRDHSVEPPIESIAYPVFVQSTDADGNAFGGIRHLMVDAPLATHAGWSPRASGYGEGDLFTILGSMIPFDATEAERQRAERLPLPEDGDRPLAAAHESWDIVSGALGAAIKTPGLGPPTTSKGAQRVRSSQSPTPANEREPLVSQTGIGGPSRSGFPDPAESFPDGAI